MNAKKINKAFHGQRATVLVTTFFLVMIASLAGLLLTQTLLDQQQLNDHRRGLWRAFYLAESGVAQVQQWAKYSSEFTQDTSLFAEATGLTAAQKLVFSQRYPNLYAEIYTNGGYTITESMLSAMDTGSFDSKYGYYVGKVKEINLLPPDSGDPINSIFKIESTGQSAHGEERVVLAYANFNEAITVDVPAALVSYNTIATAGNGKVHWGEAWSKADVTMGARNSYTYVPNDPEVIYRSMGSILFPSSWKALPANNADYDASLDDMGLDDWTGHFLQNQTEADFPSAWPEFDYETYKNMALLSGQYYTTDASGNILNSAGEAINFTEEFNFTDRADAPYDLIFIDTTDGTAPYVNADGSTNMATISHAGSIALKGFYYFCANLSFTGQGNPGDSFDVTDPYGSLTTLDPSLDGILYGSGTIDFGGNRTIFGAVVTEGGFTGGGTPDIYYNQDLSDGLDIGGGNTGAPFSITMQTNYGI